nr:hypothetical protein [Tanacetum cinerariifolium]
MSYEDVRPVFERVSDQIHVFVPMDSKIEKEVMKKSGFDLQQKQSAKEVNEKKDESSSKSVGGSRKKTVSKGLVLNPNEESAKRQKLEDVTEEEATAYKVNYEPLSRKFPIVSWEYQLLENMEAKDMKGDLRMIFDPNENDELWMNQLDWKLLRWKLHENCVVHTLFMDGTPMEINMLVEKKYPLIKELLEKMLNLQLEAEKESTIAFELIKFIKSLLEE